MGYLEQMLSVIIPTLNAADSLQETLRSLPAAEVVVSDGGSSDGTPELAQRCGARMVSGPPGRGGQLARGADAASGDWLLFLHADTRLGAGADRHVGDHIADPDNRFRAAVFTFALDDERLRARWLERAVALRCRLFALPYGDQGLLISRAFYDSIGGFRPLPLMEDVDILRRIGRARLRLLPVAGITSAARYRRDGYGRRMARNLTCLGLYAVGVSPARIMRLYNR